MTSTIERDFDHWRRRGDAAAIGRVFDALAPQLLLVAAHLAGGSAAEDLVQATFLDAIQHKERWDAARPLAPWLVGILANHVRMELRRRERQQRAEGGIGWRDDVADAGRQAENNELAAAVQRAVAGLPRHYHQVLSLRFVHGLDLQQIALSLRLPLGTVKTRLHRGMALVKRALPATLAATFAAALPSGRTLAAVRSEVLARAGAGAAAVGAGIGLGLGWFVGALAVVGAVAAAVVWRDDTAASVALPPAVADGLAAGSAAPPAGAAPLGDAQSRSDASEPAAPAATESAARAVVGDGVVVRAADADTGAPIEHFWLRASRDPGDSMFVLERKQQFEGEHAGGKLFVPTAEFAHRTWLLEDADHRYLPSRWFDADDAVVVDGQRTIEIRLPRPVAVRLQVVREHGGAPIAGTAVELLRPWPISPAITLSTQPQPVERFRAQQDEMERAGRFGGRALLLGGGTTDATGRVSLRAPPDEPLAVRLLGPGHRPTVLQPWQVGAGAAAVDVTVPVTTGATIRGRLGPLDALARLRPELPPPPSQSTSPSSWAMGIALQRRGTNELIPPGLLPAVLAVAADGTFTADGLAAGDWRIFAFYPLQTQPPGPVPAHASPPMRTMHELSSYRQVGAELPGVDDLHDHELRVIDFDIAALVPGTIDAAVRLDGHPLADGQVSLMPFPWPGLPRRSSNIELAITSPGRTHAALPPAHYLATRLLRPTGGTRVATVPLGVFEVRSGESTHVELDATTSLASFRVVEADGTTPASGDLTVRAELAGAPWFCVWAADATGRIDGASLPQGLTLRASFSRARDPAAAAGTPTAPPIELGVIAPATDLTTLRLPPR